MASASLNPSVNTANQGPDRADKSMHFHANKNGKKTQEEEFYWKFPKKIQRKRHPKFIPPRSSGFQIAARSASSSISDSLLPLLLTELKSAAAQTSKPWSGTALNLLDGVLRAAEYRSVEVPGLNADMLVEMAIPIARDASAPLNARLPALQLAARHDSPAARDLAREILSSPQSGLMLVQCASGALARLGTPADLPLLQTVSASATRHTAPAINQAIQSIQSRSANH